MTAFETGIQHINGWVWGWTLVILILAVGLLLSVRTRFVQVRHCGLALRCAISGERQGEGEVSAFAALCTALSATIGTGNIVGVATAITAGGPGALFWMLAAAVLGMATKYAEGLLAVLYRVQKPRGHFLGGPFMYIEQGMGPRWRWLAKLFALMGALAGLLGIGTVAQVSGIAGAVERFFDPQHRAVALMVGGRPFTWAVVLSGAVVTLLSALVLLGGVKRIAAVAQVVVPFMAVTYVALSLLILVRCRAQLPAAIGLVIRSAFRPEAAFGAACGITLKMVIQKGVSRGIFSNEAGLGSAPIAAAAACTQQPVEQGLVCMTGTLIDTIIICSMTGLCVIVTGAWQQPELEGVQVTDWAWQCGLPWSPVVSSFLLMLCLCFFAYTTVIGWNYYAERCLEYLTDNRLVMQAYRYLYIAAVFIGPYLTVSAVWDMAEIFNGLMAFPNLIALVALSGEVGKETRAYFTKKHRSR